MADCVSAPEWRPNGVAVNWPRFSPGRPEIAGRFICQQLTGPAFWTLIVARDAAILPHLRRPVSGLEMTLEVGVALIRAYGPERWPAGVASNRPRYAHRRPKIAEHSSSINGAAFWTLIAAKGASILAHLRHSSSGLGMTPEK